MKKITAVCCLLFFACTSFSQFRYEDKLRIAEAETIKNTFGSDLWKGLRSVPFTVLLVTDSGEYLINHPKPTADFTNLGFDTLLHSEVYFRKSTFQKNFLATFPAVGGVNCIVVGTPENTGKTSTEWIITLLHEHFHIYEYTSTGYYAAVDSLGLSGGDQSGMWMLNYPFPYTDEEIEKAYKQYKTALGEALSSASESAFFKTVPLYLKARKQFVNLLKIPDYRYLSFQLWQEGIARYTEYKYLQVMTADNYQPSEGIKLLPDFIPFEVYKEKMYKEEMRKLSAFTLKNGQRLSFYALGFAEGLLLDRLNPAWHEQFLKKKFYIEEYAK